MLLLLDTNAYLLLFNHMVKYNNEELTAVFHALADPTRRKLIEILTRGPRSVTDLAASFSISLPAVSKHLKIMESAGVINRQQKGRVHEMSLRPESLEMGTEWLAWHKDFWRANLSALKSYLEDEKEKLDGE